MRTIKEIYKIGHGPSSSHTMGPSFAAEIFLKNIPDIRKADITLYGSLAATGKGHLTDKALTFFTMRAWKYLLFGNRKRFFLFIQTQ